MKHIKQNKLWDSLQSSYWFLPGLMALAGMLLAIGMLALDQSKMIQAGELSWIYQGGPEGARGLLSAVAGSMVTVAATAFSITIVALQLAASNFGPRLLRNFMQDTGNQVVLGTFLATFLYCLLILRTIHGEDYDLFIPQLSITVGIGLAVASIGVLIYFIHHASTIIQASHVIAEVAKDLDEAIERLFPEALGQSEETPEEILEQGLKTEEFAEAIPQDSDTSAYAVYATHTGYLQMVDDDILFKLSYQYQFLLRLISKPGEFVIKGNPLVMVYAEERFNRLQRQKLTQEINRAFLLGKERTEQQDIEFPIDQLVEIALRALSPGINDPFTAVRCIDRLSAGLSHLAERSFPSAYRYDADHKLRVIVVPVAFTQLVDAAFNQIRDYGKSDLVVTIQLLNAIAQIASRTHCFNNRLALQQQAQRILQGSHEGLSCKQDQQRVEKLYHQIHRTYFAAID